jgi:hypothetical protein
LIGLPFGRESGARCGKLAPMLFPRRALLLLTPLLILLVTGCGSTVSSGPTTSVHESNPPTSATSPSTIAAAPRSTSPPTAAGTHNLTITDADRTQLVQAAAALNNVPAADFVGLVPGDTYFAYDGPTATYWAGAKLDPGSSQPAQVSTQDDGAYVLFHRPAGADWIAQDVGLAGVEGGKCPVVVPAAILALWNWGPGTCRPAGV